MFIKNIQYTSWVVNMNGTILQMFLKSLKALILADANEVDKLLIGIPLKDY